MRNSISIEEVYQCIREIENGKTISEVVQEKYIKPGTLRSYILEYGGERGKKILLKELEEQLPISIEEIIERYNSGKTTEDIADELGLSHFGLGDIISRYEAISGKKISKKRSANKREDIDDEYVIEEYRKGIGITKIAKDIDASVTAVKKRVDDYKKNTENDIEQEHEENSKKIKTLKKLREKRKKKYVSKKIETETKEDQKEKESEQIKLIEEIIRKYGYSYEKLSEIASKRGYEVTTTVYYQALNNIKRDEERDE